MLSASISPRRSNCAVTQCRCWRHDDAHRLLQLHDARVDETDAHDGGGGGALDQPGDDGPQKDPLEYVAGKTLQDMLSRPLESFSRPSVMVDIPNGNVAMAPNMATIFAISKMLPNLTPRSNFRKILLISDHDKLCSLLAAVRKYRGSDFFKNLAVSLKAMGKNRQFRSRSAGEARMEQDR